jgi:hypothetical protein
VRARILIALSAWLLGAAIATGGWLMAVSLLGDGFGLSRSSSQQLTVAAVKKALAAATPGRSPTPSAPPTRGARARDVRRHPLAAPPTPTQSASAAGTPISSPAGTVVAVCGSAGVYLQSWFPAQGYGVQQVNPGPAAVASVVFAAGTHAVTLSVVCRDGTPVNNSSEGDDRGGSGHHE